jgi:hypothetical protein
MPMDEIVRIVMFIALGLVIVCQFANVIHNWATDASQLYYLPTSKIYLGVFDLVVLVGVILFYTGVVSAYPVLTIFFGYPIFHNTYSIVMRRKAVKNASQTDPVLQ